MFEVTPDSTLSGDVSLVSRIPLLVLAYVLQVALYPRVRCRCAPAHAYASKRTTGECRVPACSNASKAAKKKVISWSKTRHRGRPRRIHGSEVSVRRTQARERERYASACTTTEPRLNTLELGGFGRGSYRKCRRRNSIKVDAVRLLLVQRTR